MKPQDSSIRIKFGNDTGLRLSGFPLRIWYNGEKYRIDIDMPGEGFYPLINDDGTHVTCDTRKEALDTCWESSTGIDETVYSEFCTLCNPEYDAKQIADFKAAQKTRLDEMGRHG